MAIESVTYHMTPHANGCDGPVTRLCRFCGSVTGCLFQSIFSNHCSLQSWQFQVLSHVPGTTLPGQFLVLVTGFWFLGRVRIVNSTAIDQFGPLTLKPLLIPFSPRHGCTAGKFNRMSLSLWIPNLQLQQRDRLPAMFGCNHQYYPDFKCCGIQL